MTEPEHQMHDMEPAQRLAVYGTLMPGQSNHHHVAGIAGTWSRGTVRGVLHPTSWGAALGYPGIVLDPDGDGVPVHVLESVDLPHHWPRLDDFEGPGYRRVVTSATTEAGSVCVSIYELVPK
jgi:gamma-glutamylcyclotransferase (GGCT)/AIG2-like uncharacterized protein YtfP